MSAVAEISLSELRFQDSYRHELQIDIESAPDTFLSHI